MNLESQYKWWGSNCYLLLPCNKAYVYTYEIWPLSSDLYFFSSKRIQYVVSSDFLVSNTQNYIFEDKISDEDTKKVLKFAMANNQNEM